MNRSGDPQRTGVVLLWAALGWCGLGPGRPPHAPAAPVPEQALREGVIVIVPGYPGTPARLLAPNGTVTGELPFDTVDSCALSPDGRDVAAVVRSGDDLSVYVVGVGANQGAVGRPLASQLSYPVVAWGRGGTLYVSERRGPPGNVGVLRPGGVTAHDPARRTAAAVKALAGCCVLDASPDGKRLLAQRFVADPEPRWEGVLVDAATGGRVDAGAEGVSLTRFLGATRALGTRAGTGAPPGPEHVVVDLAARRVSPVPVPRAVAGGGASVLKVLPSPDGKRLLYVWTEEVPGPAGWPPGVPCRVTRLTTADPDGGNARTIFRPEIRERADEVRNHVGSTVDWR